MSTSANGQESDAFVPDRREKSSNVKRVLAQLMATAGFGMMVLSVGTLLTCPTIIIGALYKPNASDTAATTLSPYPNQSTVYSMEMTSTASSFYENTSITPHWHDNGTNLRLDLIRIQNETETTEIQLTKMQAAWFGSIIYVIQPVGSIGSGFIQGHLGRRNGMMATSVVQLIGWLSLYFCSDVGSMFTAATLMGLSIGFMEAPGLSFLGEVIEPKFRGAFSNLAMNLWLFGALLEYLLGALVDWRTVCLASAAIPVINFLILCLLPESPTFLLLRGREREAEASLRWLRGWTKHEVIRDEYQALFESLNIPYKHNGTYLTPSTDNNGTVVSSSKKSKGQLAMICERRVGFPLFLLALFFFTQHCVSLVGPKLFLVKIFASLNMQIEPHWIMVCSGVLQLLGITVCVFALRHYGKKRMILISGSSSTIICFLLSVYMFLKPGLPIIPLVLFAANFFCNGLGIMSMPWCLIAEVFPTECRGIAAGIAAASSYILGFLVTITYVHLESVVSLAGCLLIYSAVGLFGTAFIHWKLPETEGKTLDEIQFLFRSKRDRNRLKQSKGLYY